MKAILVICASFLVWIGGLLNGSSVTFPWELGGGCGWDARWSFDEDTNTLTISGTGDMDTSAPWNKWNDKIYYIVIEDGITSICDKAFADTKELKEITIPESMTSIGEEAFRTTGLPHINLPDSITHIGVNAFAWSKLEEVTLPAGMTKVSYHTFYSCKNLKKVVIQDGMTTIGDGAFYDCSALQTIVIPDSVTVIESSVFEHCYSLKEISLSPNIDCISYACFRGCSSLQEIVIPDKVTRIEDFAFDSCYDLQKLTWGNDIEYIGGCAFYDCRKLETLVIPAAVKEIGEHVFGEMKNLRAISFLGDCLYNKYSVDLNDVEIWYPSDNTTWKYFPEYVDNVVWKEGCGGGHDWVEVEGVQPTCTQDGCGTYICCQICGFSSTYPKVIFATGHSYSPWVYITPAGTPDEKHKVTRACTCCGNAETTYAQNVDPSKLPEAPSEAPSEVPSETPSETPENPIKLDGLAIVIMVVIIVCAGLIVCWTIKKARVKT